MFVWSVLQRFIAGKVSWLAVMVTFSIIGSGMPFSLSSLFLSVSPACPTTPLVDTSMLPYRLIIDLSSVLTTGLRTTGLLTWVGWWNLVNSDWLTNCHHHSLGLHHHHHHHNNRHPTLSLSLLIVSGNWCCVADDNVLCLCPQVWY